MWSEPILHVDMDSFFVEVERSEHPGLAGLPVAVGGTGSRGVIASASYEARAAGVRSAQPTVEALRRCPDLILINPSHGRYAEMSEQVFSVFRSFTPLVEGLSLDEAFLDVRGLRHHHESPVAVAKAIRARIREETRLPASVGIATVKFIAKLASEDAKPDGILLIKLSEQAEYLAALPASRMWGVGPATQAALQRLGVETIGDIAALPPEILTTAVGPSLGTHLSELARGEDPRAVVPDSQAKSVSVERTYDRDLMGREVVTTALLEHSNRLSGRLRRAGLVGRTVTVKVRFPDFRTVSKSLTMPDATDSARSLFGAARSLIEDVELDEGVRLLGIAATGLSLASEPAQVPLTTEQNWNDLEQAVADVHSKFGEQAVRPARLSQPKSSRLPEEP